MPGRRPPPHAYFVVSAVFHYLGPAFAVLLFARIEVLGVAWRNVTALVGAVAGVYLVTDVRLVAEPLGVAFAAANAVLFALYIVLGHRVARGARVPGVDGLGLSMLIAAVIALPAGIGPAWPAFTDPVALAAAAGVGSVRRSSRTSATNSPWPGCPERRTP
jgi:threonine/homoserine efflux transporter RhtA